MTTKIVRGIRAWLATELAGRAYSGRIMDTWRCRSAEDASELAKKVAADQHWWKLFLLRAAARLDHGVATSWHQCYLAALRENYIPAIQQRARTAAEPAFAVGRDDPRLLAAFRKMCRSAASAADAFGSADEAAWFRHVSLYGEEENPGGSR